MPSQFLRVRRMWYLFFLIKHTACSQPTVRPLSFYHWRRHHSLLPCTLRYGLHTFHPICTHHLLLLSLLERLHSSGPPRNIFHKSLDHIHIIEPILCLSPLLPLPGIIQKDSLLRNSYVLSHNQSSSMSFLLNLLDPILHCLLTPRSILMLRFRRVSIH